jgi:uncharacterized protein YbaP (TraB family)
LIRRIFRLVLPLIFGCLSTGAALAEPALWRVSDSDSSVWLFGSVHILDPSVTWRTPAFNEVLSGAEEVYFELVLNGDSMAALGRLTIERGFLPAGQTLADMLTPDQNKRLDKALEELGLPRPMIEPMQPWMAALTLSTTALTKSGEAGAANFAGGIESQLQAEIEDDRERGLETAEEQMDFLSGGTPEEQAAALMQTVDQLDEANASFSGLLDAWEAGDMETVHSEIVVSVGSMESPEYQTLVADRNERWTTTIRGLLADNVDALIVVGAAHVAGPVGLPALLADLGFTVERVDAGGQ